MPVDGEPGERVLPADVRDRVLVHSLHDGQAIPEAFRMTSGGQPRVDPAELERRFVLQRDWGANTVAKELARALGVNRYGRVRVARVLLDFNRFPGSTPPNVFDPLERLAISEPFAEALDHETKADLLERYYDGISSVLEAKALVGRVLTITVHTYDELNPSLTVRPDVSLITRPAAYQIESRMPYGVFDPIYPDRLGESTCSRVARDRISLELERAGWHVSQNHPYALPNGSFEVRAQVWYFFHYLRERFEAALPHTRGDSAYTRVWELLQNTNQRQAESEALRGYLHRFRKVTRAQRAKFQETRAAYERVREFLHHTSTVRDYQHSPERPSSLALEVRKDLLCQFDPQTGLPLPMTDEQRDRARQIARVIANAIIVYFETDRPRALTQPPPPP